VIGDENPQSSPSSVSGQNVGDFSAELNSPSHAIFTKKAQVACFHRVAWIYTKKNARRGLPSGVEKTKVMEQFLSPPTTFTAVC